MWFRKPKPPRLHIDRHAGSSMPARSAAVALHDEQTSRTSRRAVVMFPQSEQLGLVESLRDRFDPLAGLIAAHVTLVFPFSGEHSTVTLRTHVENVLHDRRSFLARFEGIREADDGYVFLDVTTGARELAELHDRLYTGPLAQYLSPVHDFRPHLTLARSSHPDVRATAVRAIRDASPAFEAAMRCVSVVRLDDAGRCDIDFVVDLLA